MLARARESADYDVAMGLLEAIAMDPAVEHGSLGTPLAGQESCARPNRMSTRLARPPTVVQDGSDASDEELYLRRVSVLYHELWTTDWIEGWPASPRSRKSTADNGCSEAIAHGARSPGPRGSWASLVDAYIGSGGGGGGDEPADDTCSTVAAADADAAGAKLLSPRPAQRARGASVHGFSPSDLADVLVGTVRRLEDDHTLLQHKRWSAVKELSITEAQYLQDLLLLKAVFYEPLTAGPGGTLLRPDDARLIFGNLDQVIDCARSLVEYLTVATVYEASRCAAVGDEGPQSSNPNARSSTGSVRAAPTQSGGGSGAGSSRPASQPEAARVGASDTSELRNSAWADISIAQAFLLTSQRMEHVYAQYCQNFEAASQRIIELKRAAMAAAAAATAATISTATPPAPLTADCPPSTSSPMAEHLRGWLAGSGTHASGGYSSPTPTLGQAPVFADVGASDLPPDPSGPDTAYEAAAYHHITSQAQCLAGKTTSWDLPSLLIKPVQRILKYPLLIRSLLGLTRTHTLDHSRLEKAAQSVERIAEAINSVHRTNGLRISTVAAATVLQVSLAGSSLSGHGDDGQGRVARELRRVLRRRTGNTGPLRARTQIQTLAPIQVEGPAKDRLRLPSRGRGWARERPERLPLYAVHGGCPPTGAAALVEQHEHRIAEVIRALREWESSVSEALRQQLDTATRWHDLYAADDDDDNDDSTALDASGPLPAAPATELGAGPLGAGCAVAGALGDLDAQLRQQWQLAAEASRRTRSALKHSHGPAPEHRRSSAETASEARRAARVGGYRAALEVIHGSLFPCAVSGPLQAKVYPVLSTLLQVYGDGPRYILGEIARASGSGAGSAAEPGGSDGNRVAKLHGVLAEDLPRLFEHERTVMRLLLVQITNIQHSFCRQAVELLRRAPLDMADRQRPRTAHTASQHAADKTTPPLSALEHTGLIRAGLWRLAQAQEAPRPESAQHAAARARNHSSRAPAADGPDSASLLSATIDDGSSASAFEPVSPNVGTGKPLPPLPPAALMAAEVPVRRRPSNATRSLAGDFASAGAGVSPCGEAQLSARPASSKPASKRQGGLMGRIVNLRPGRIIRGHQGAAMATDRLADGALDNIKPRPRSESTLRARSDADIRGAAAAAVAGWAVDAARFEPLPLVDSIRFSKGFVDAAFQIFNSPDRPGAEAAPAPVGPGVAPSTSAGGRQ